MKKQFNLLVIFCLSLLFSGCSVVQQTYDFYHHGTDSINTSKNFRYLEKNVMGKSKVTQDFQLESNETGYGSQRNDVTSKRKFTRIGR